MTDGLSEFCQWNGPWSKTGMEDEPLTWTDDEIVEEQTEDTKNGRHEN